MRNNQWLTVFVFTLGACSTTVDGSMQNDLGAADARVPGVQPDAEPLEEPQLETIVLRQGTGTPVANANVNCRYGEQGPNADTRHLRVFPAVSIGGSKITEATLPIEIAESPGGIQPATLKVHRLTGDILAGEFELLAEVPFEVPDQVLGEVRVPLDVDIAQADAVVIEVAMADGEQLRNLRFGYNLEPQTAPTYYASNTCGQLLPLDLATLANPFVQGATFAANSWLVSVTTERLQ